jgi:XapX domain-containing protein
MKVLLISFAVGLFVGILYGVIRVKSPALPIVALLGLLGMVLGEQVGGWILTKNVSVAHASSICLVGKRWVSERMCNLYYQLSLTRTEKSSHHAR